MENTPASLLERLRSPGEQQAWERFVLLYSPLLCYWVRKIGAPPNEVADLVQEIFTILVQKLPEFRYDPGKRFRGWLWTITLNKCRERCRRLPPYPAGDLLPDPTVPDGTETIDEAEYQRYLMKRALQLMQTEFQPTTWQVFWECVIVGRSAAEVSRQFGLTVDAVYAAKSRVLRCLRQELADLLE